MEHKPQGTPGQRGEGDLPLGGGGLAHPLADLEGYLPALDVDDDVIAVQDLAVEDFEGERVLHQLLDSALQRPRSEVRVVAFGKEEFLRGVGQLERDFSVGP